MSRVKQLQKELVTARAQLKDLTTKNRVLKTMEAQQGNALSKYEESNARMPQMIKSYAEEIRSWQDQLQQAKKSYQNLDISYRTQTAELQVARNQLKRLTALTKNKQLDDRQALSNRLKEAETNIKLEEDKTRSLLKQLKLQSQNFSVQMDRETRKKKVLQMNLMNMKKTNHKLEEKKLKYTNYLLDRFDINDDTKDLRKQSIRQVKKNIINSNKK